MPRLRALLLCLFAAALTMASSPSTSASAAAATGVELPLARRVLTHAAAELAAARLLARGPLRLRAGANASLPLADFDDIEFVANVSVGTPPAPFRFALHTGSGNTWLPTPECNDFVASPACMYQAKYDSAKSSSFRPCANASLLGAGSCLLLLPLTDGNETLIGSLGNETFSFAPGVAVPTAEFGMLSFEPLPRLIGLAYDGVVGLAFPASTFPLLSPPAGLMPLLIAQGALSSPSFSFYLDPAQKPGSPGGPGSSAFVLGGSAAALAAKYADSPLVTVAANPVWQPLLGLWAVQLDYVFVNGLLTTACDKCIAVFDSASMFISAPPAALAQILPLLPALAPDCSNAALMPNITLQFAGQPFVLGHDDYVLRLPASDYNATTVCSLALRAFDASGGLGLPIFVVGTPFMRAFFTTYDVPSAAVSIAHARALSPSRGAQQVEPRAAARRGSAAVWPASAYSRATATVAQLSLEEKLGLVSGENKGYANCSSGAKSCSYVGWNPGVPRLQISDIFLEDGPQGVADGMTGVTFFPSVMTVSQAWDADLAEAFGAAMGAEQVLKGSNVMLGPAVALVRCPWSGRNFEYIGEDPVLNAAVSGALVRGIQGNNISASVKHWIFNSQETDRSGMSSNVPERVGRELYEAPYRAAIDAGVGTVLCSFNRINTTWSCANDAGLNGWLKADLGFDGWVVSDWGATHNTSAFALGGLDQEQEWVENATFFGETLGAYVANGSVPLARLDDMATRVLRAMYALGFDAPRSESYNKTTPANSTAHAQLAAELAHASLVLLKNDASALPLPPPAQLPRGVLVVGLDTYNGGGGSGHVEPPYSVSTPEGLARAAPGLKVTYDEGGNVTRAAELAAQADAVIVIASVAASEGMDRANLSLGCAPWAGDRSCTWWPDQDALIFAVAAANARTVVALRTPGAVLMPWLDRVPAVVHQLYAGQEAGTALGAALVGARNPRGKLTISFPASMEDTWLSAPGGGPVLPERYPGTDRGRGFPEVDYDEGLAVGYRHYDAEGTAPLFPFGHGLSFSSFAYSSLAVAGAVSPLSNASVSLLVAQTGGPPGVEVVQLYVASALPGDPPKALKAFARVSLGRGEQAPVAFSLSQADLAVWSAAAHAFVPFPPGSYALWVGSSSRDLRLQGSVAVAA